MRKNVKKLIKGFAEKFEIQEPIIEIGSFLVEGQEELADLRPLFKGKKYIGCDMRPGPGVDRIEDVSIPEEYKFDDNNIENFSNIGEKIRECFRDYDKKINDFHCYREKIRKEPMVFLDNLKEIFKK